MISTLSPAIKLAQQKDAERYQLRQQQLNTAISDYFEKAISIQKKPDILNKIKYNLRSKALSSPLFDTESFTKDFTEILKKIYLKHMGSDKY